MVANQCNVPVLRLLDSEFDVQLAEVFKESVVLTENVCSVFDLISSLCVVLLSVTLDMMEKLKVNDDDGKTDETV